MAGKRTPLITHPCCLMWLFGVSMFLTSLKNETIKSIKNFFKHDLRKPFSYFCKYLPCDYPIPFLIIIIIIVIILSFKFLFVRFMIFSLFRKPFLGKQDTRIESNKITSIKRKKISWWNNVIR